MESINLIRYIGALLLTLALIGGGVVFLRRFAPHLLAGGGNFPSLKPKTERRMKLVETLTLDPKRRAVILACDQTETLIILGPAGETVVRELPARNDATPETT